MGKLNDRIEAAETQINQIAGWHENYTYTHNVISVLDLIIIAINRDVVSVSTSRSRDHLETY